MTSNLLSRILPSGSPSVYEALRAEDETSDTADIEERAGMALDEENLGRHDFDLDPEVAEDMEGRIRLEDSPPGRSERGASAQPHSRWHHRDSPRRLEGDEADDDVPPSLLVETNEAGIPISRPSPDPRPRGDSNPIPVAGHATREAQAQWTATQQQQRLHRDPHIRPAYSGRPGKRNKLIVDPREKALWRWTNVQNLDNFLGDVYGYFLGKGIWSILLSRLLSLLTTAFVIGFSVFLSSCVNYKELPHRNKLDDILIRKCTQKMSALPSFILWVSVFVWIAKLFLYLLDIRRLKILHDFYHYLLEVPDTDIQTISWQDIVKKLMALRDLNPSTAAQVSPQHRRFLGAQSKQRMDAHDIANRLMRRDNYLIALFNKEILDITLPLPPFNSTPLFSKSLEWSLSLCILDLVFNEQGQVSPQFLKDTQRRPLSKALQRRFLVAGLMNIVCAPFIIVYLVVWYFFRYFNEYQKNPSSIGSRQYTPFAEWRFREFNELAHLFEKRIHMSYPFASRYINEFPKKKTVQVASFVAFVSGALAGVLGITSLIDPDLFLGFEITPDRTVLFYLGVFTAIWAFANGAVTEEGIVFDPEHALTVVINYTHYCPNQWRGRLHSDEVRRDFAGLYKVKAVIFLEELFSLVTTPFVLWFSLPKCSDRIVDFFREFTIHVDGLGYVCSFAVFDFEKGGNVAKRPRTTPGGEDPDLRDDYYSTKDGKMLASYYNFVDNYVNNPKQGAAYQTSPAKQFHPPPAFPGLTSSNVIGDGQASGHGKHDPWDRHQRRSSRHGMNLGTTSQRTPRFAPIVGQASPMTSILLDPHHQPFPTSFRTSHRPAIHSRLRNSRKPITDLIEDEEDEIQPRTVGEVSGSASGDDCHQLGESWETTKPGAADEDNDEDGGVRTSEGANNPGVLGLVYQFSKAQTEGRGAGAQI